MDRSLLDGEDMIKWWAKIIVGERRILVTQVVGQAIQYIMSARFPCGLHFMQSTVRSLDLSSWFVKTKAINDYFGLVPLSVKSAAS